MTDTAIHRCMKRLVRAEKLITELLRAHDASEAQNEQAAIEQLRKFIEQV
jgi:hypothetical protein